MGVIIYEMIHGKVPWNCSTEEQLKVEIMKNNISLLKNLSEDLKDFIRKCLVVDQNKRISLFEFAKHPFVARICGDGIPQLLKKPTSGN
jgi:serine/threonine protein kinase